MNELASRPLMGFPDAEIKLVFDEGNIEVVISDHTGVTVWKPKDRRDASDMYFHPFARGYKYPPRKKETEDDGA